MIYHSTNDPTSKATLRDAVFAGLAPDGGLYMPDKLPWIPKAFFNNLNDMTMPEIGYVVANTLFGQDIESRKLKEIIFNTLNFDIPFFLLEDNIYVMELFHGPTLAINDVSARFMSRLVQFMLGTNPGKGKLNILVATSGDTGSAVAKAFHDVKGVNTFVLYPKGEISRLREAQFTSLGGNVHPIEVAGTYADCQQLLNQALTDPDLKSRMKITTGNSINIARFMPQMLYFFWAYARLLNLHGQAKVNDKMVFAVPRGNLGNICSAVVAERMGLPIKRLVAAAMHGDAFSSFLGCDEPADSTKVPSNLARLLDLFCREQEEIASHLSAYTFTQDTVNKAIAETESRLGYIMSPKTAKAYLGLKKSLLPDEIGILFATTHPAKFLDQVEYSIGKPVEIPEPISSAMSKPKRSDKIPATYSAFKKLLLSKQ